MANLYKDAFSCGRYSFFGNKFLGKCKWVMESWLFKDFAGAVKMFSFILSFQTTLNIV